MVHYRETSYGDFLSGRQDLQYIKFSVSSKFNFHKICAGSFISLKKVRISYNVPRNMTIHNGVNGTSELFEHAKRTRRFLDARYTTVRFVTVPPAFSGWFAFHPAEPPLIPRVALPRIPFSPRTISALSHENPSSKYEDPAPMESRNSRSSGIHDDEYILATSPMNEQWEIPATPYFEYSRSRSTSRSRSVR